MRQPIIVVSRPADSIVTFARDIAGFAQSPATPAAKGAAARGERGVRKPTPHRLLHARAVHARRHCSRKKRDQLAASQ